MVDTASRAKGETAFVACGPEMKRRSGAGVQR